jgi:thiol-disulfide isomerase/thioredoxin
MDLSDIFPDFSEAALLRDKDKHAYKILQPKDANDLFERLLAGRSGLMTLYLPDCPHCQDFLPELDKLAAAAALKKKNKKKKEDKLDDKQLLYAVLDAEAHPEVAAVLGLNAFPAILLVKDGKVMRQLEDRSPAALKRELSGLDSSVGESLSSSLPSSSSSTAEPERKAPKLKKRRQVSEEHAREVEQTYQALGTDAQFREQQRAQLEHLAQKFDADEAEGTLDPHRYDLEVLAKSRPVVIESIKLLQPDPSKPWQSLFASLTGPKNGMLVIYDPSQVASRRFLDEYVRLAAHGSANDYFALLDASRFPNVPKTLIEEKVVSPKVTLPWVIMVSDGHLRHQVSKKQDYDQLKRTFAGYFKQYPVKEKTVRLHIRQGGSRDSASAAPSSSSSLSAASSSSSSSLPSSSSFSASSSSASSL